MKKTVAAFLLVAASIWNAQAQSQPAITISNAAPGAIEIDWLSSPGSAYRLVGATDLASSNAWAPIEDVYPIDTNGSIVLSTAGNVCQFFVLTNLTTGSGSGQIFSPTNGQTLTGVAAVQIGADLGGSFCSAQIYLDNVLIGSIMGGQLEFDLDTAQFPNGSHTIGLSVVTSQNTVSATASLSVTFQNSIHWLDADSLFQSFVPINVTSDIYPTNWTITVVDTNNTTVRTITGLTSDGTISTNWDGSDDNGVQVPTLALYQISVMLGTNNPGQQGQGGSGGPPPLMMSEGTTSIEPPVLPPLPPGMVIPGMDPAAVARTTAWLTTMMAARSGVTANGAKPDDGLPGGAGSGQRVGNIVWRETSWGSGQIVLARQNIPGTGGLLFNGVIANTMANIRNLVAVLGLANSRGVYQDNLFVVQNNAGFAPVFNALIDPTVTAFYWWGHGSPDGNTLGPGISATTLFAALGNYYTPLIVPRWRPIVPAIVTTRLPFSFVFLDGCRTALGNLPEAFGIPKAVSAAQYAKANKQKRCFMGWNGVVSMSLLDTGTLNWSQAFWSAWLASSDVLIRDAIANANGHWQPSGTILTYGDPSLTYGQ